MFHRILTSVIGSVLLFCASASADHYEHPRLFFSKADEVILKERIKSDPLAEKLSIELMRRAEMILTAPTCKHYIKDGRRLLSQSRLALHNILHTAMAWRMSGERKYLDRAILELDAVCQFKDWNPSHFLDTAEMSTAVAIGYDWLYHDLTPEQQDQFSKALRKLGLEPARNGYSEPNRAWWSNHRNNWTQVCAAGLLITERALEKEGDTLHPSRLEARAVLEGCDKFYLPSGGYPEGPSYWHYGSNYHVLGIAATQNDREKMAIAIPAVFKSSALFPEHLTGQTSYVFNFADSGSKAQKSKISPAQTWMVSKFDDSMSIAHIRNKIEQDIEYVRKHKPEKLSRFFPLHLLWLPEAKNNSTPILMLDSKWLGSQPVATFRSSWTDPNGMYLAIKGGLPGASHGHMDIGSFVFESDGVRWVEDLGAENYNLPDYFSEGHGRWKYYRLSNFSHNTLVIGGKLQDMNAVTSPMIAFQTNAAGGYAKFDITPAYEAQADKIERLAHFDRQHKSVTISDKIIAPKDAVRWAIVTRASIEIKGSTAILKSNGKVLNVIRDDNHGGEWKIRDAKPSTAAERQNEGYKILSFTAPIADELELSVTFKP